jgi:glyoxylase-like metal-dependent hydrolase (beta-lactamase superfamily II)
MNRLCCIGGFRAVSVAAVLAAAVLAVVPTAFAQPRAQVREIVPLTGDLYRARNGNWYAIFLVTPDGIILGDPINNAFATWLKTELDARFDVPVRYGVYSPSHFDHAEGGGVFADTALFVGPENLLRTMDGRYPQMPGDMIARNKNGRFDHEDIDVPTEAAPGICGFSRAFFTMFDHDGDTQVTPAEMQRDIVPPDLVYSERMTLRLGGRRVELIHPGLNHSDDATVMYFPDERVVFATEFLADALVTDDVHSLPSACGPFDGSPLSEWIASYRTVEALDFDIVAPGHGAVFDKAGVTATRRYFEDLTAAVSAGMAAGRSLDELKRTVMLEDYADWANYARLRERNIEGAYNNLLLYRR